METSFSGLLSCCCFSLFYSPLTAQLVVCKTQPSCRPQQQLARLVPVWCSCPLPPVKALLSIFQSNESVSNIPGSSKNEGSSPLSLKNGA